MRVRLVTDAVFQSTMGELVYIAAGAEGDVVPAITHRVRPAASPSASSASLSSSSSSSFLSPSSLGSSSAGGMSSSLSGLATAPSAADFAHPFLPCVESFLPASSSVRLSVNGSSSAGGSSSVGGSGSDSVSSSGSISTSANFNCNEISAGGFSLVQFNILCPELCRGPIDLSYLAPHMTWRRREQMLLAGIERSRASVFCLQVSSFLWMGANAQTDVTALCMQMVWNPRMLRVPLTAPSFISYCVCFPIVTHCMVFVKICSLSYLSSF
jgi:hypothetical protein